MVPLTRHEAKIQYRVKSLPRVQLTANWPFHWLLGLAQLTALHAPDAADDNNIAPLPLNASFNSSQANHDLFS
jgi:hypothetical protein